MRKLQEVYFGAEQNYYYRKTLGMVLVFEWIRNEKNRLDQAKEILNSWSNDKDPETDFLALYHGNKQGVLIYGKVEPLTVK